MNKVNLTQVILNRISLFTQNLTHAPNKLKNGLKMLETFWPLKGLLHTYTHRHSHAFQSTFNQITVFLPIFCTKWVVILIFKLFKWELLMAYNGLPPQFETG